MAGPFQAFLGSFWDFVLAVASHWAYLIGGVGATVILFLAERIVWKKPLSRRTVAAIMGLALFVSCFLAWRDERASVVRLEAARGALERENAALAARLDEMRRERQTAEAAAAPRSPSLHLLYQGAQLDGRTIEIGKSGPSSLSAIEIHNSGSGATSGVSMRLYLSTSGVIRSLDLTAWQAVESDDPRFPQAFHWGGPAHISRGETWIGPSLSALSLGAATATIRAKIELFYGVDKPAKAHFTIRARP